MNSASDRDGSDQDRPLVPLHYDTVFRWLFGDEHNKRLLGAFLRAALPDLPSGEWTDLTLPDTHMVGAVAGQKEAVLDVKVTTASGRSVDVEIQMASVPAARERFTYYSSRQLAEQLAPGEPYTKLRPVVTLVICGFVMIDDDDYRHTIVDYDVEHQMRFTHLRETRTLELPKIPPVDDMSVAARTSSTYGRWSCPRFRRSTTVPTCGTGCG